jgi:hypothetical protein
MHRPAAIYKRIGAANCVFELHMLEYVKSHFVVYLYTVRYPWEEPKKFSIAFLFYNDHRKIDTFLLAVPETK